MSKKPGAGNDLPQDVDSLASLLAEQRSALVDNVASIREIADPAVIREAAQGDAAQQKQGFLSKVPHGRIPGTVVGEGSVAGDSSEQGDQRQFMLVAGAVVAVVAAVVLMAKRRKSRKAAELEEAVEAALLAD